MFSRKFLMFFGLVLVAAVVAATVEAKESDKVPKEISEIIKIIGQAIKWAAKKCLREAAEHCRHHWPNSKAVVECAKEFFQQNKGRCIID